MKLKPYFPENYGYFLFTEATELTYYKEKIVNFAVREYENKLNLDKGFNISITRNDLIEVKYVYDYFVDVCAANFTNIILDQRNREIAWAYVQNKEKNFSIWHNHKRTTTINAVWYPKLPDPTGTLAIREGEAVDEVKIQENNIYFFPYWMDHKPMPQKKSMDWRVSINLELLTTSRPYHPETQALW